MKQAFRYNNRKDLSDADRFSLAITGIVGRRLGYNDLIGRTPGALFCARRAARGS